MSCHVLPCAAMCCHVLPCAAMCCLVLPCPAMCCLVLPCAAMSCHVLPCAAMCCHVLPCPAMCCHVLPCAAMCCHVLPCHPCCCMHHTRQPAPHLPTQAAHTGLYLHCFAATAAAAAPAVTQAQAYSQCGGTSGPCGSACRDAAWPHVSCPATAGCARLDQFYWQCQPGAPPVATAAASSSGSGSSGSLQGPIVTVVKPSPRKLQPGLA
jgi:hypothetical protein